jgi:hypothetical protein
MLYAAELSGGDESGSDELRFLVQVTDQWYKATVGTGEFHLNLSFKPIHVRPLFILRSCYVSSDVFQPESTTDHRVF